MRKEFLITISILIIYSVSIAVFFVLIPSEFITPTNFIDYAASLSTIVMVLIYILTTSRQLNTMQDQLKEMEATRNLQTQPLPYPKVEKAEIAPPNFWGFPHDRFEKIYLVYDVRFEGKINNIGNSPAIGVDCFPSVVCLETKGSKLSGGPLCMEDKTFTKAEMLRSEWKRIECISLKDGDSNVFSCVFPDDHAMIESFLSQRLTREQLRLAIFYKNILGASFKLEMVYEIGCPKAEIEKIKSYLKSMKSAKVDYSKELIQYRKLRANGQREKADRIFSKLRDEFPTRYKLENVTLDLTLIPGSFSVKPIDEEDYVNELTERVEAYEERLPLVRTIKE